MTPERMRIVLAEWDGWTSIGCWNGNPKQPAGFRPQIPAGCDKTSRPLPDYPNSWDAIHELVDKLDRVRRCCFLGEINNVTRHRSSVWFPERIVTSTRIEWCEALLRTLNLW
jgi:hypothetical protein